MDTKHRLDPRLGPILVFVPGKAEIRLLTELIKNAVERGYTAGIVSVWIPFGYSRPRSELLNYG